MVLIVLLAVSFTGCRGYDPETAFVLSDAASFSYPGSYGDGIPEDYEYVFRSGDNCSFRFHISTKSEIAADKKINTEDVTAEKIAERYTDTLLNNKTEADGNYTAERDESLIIGGKTAKLVFSAVLK